MDNEMYQELIDAVTEDYDNEIKKRINEDEMYSTWMEPDIIAHLIKSKDLIEEGLKDENPNPIAEAYVMISKAQKLLECYFRG